MKDRKRGWPIQKVPSKNVTLVVCGLLLLAGGFGVLSYERQEISIMPRQIILPADGAEHQAFRIRLPWWFFHDTAIETSEPHMVRILGNAGLIKAPVNPGSTQAHLQWRGRPHSIPITFVLDTDDSYSDGTPDFLRLHTAQDRYAFRSWFTAVAEGQAEAPANQLAAEINDCAALLRYAYREALHAHDENWLSGHVTEAPRPSVQQYTYPKTPLGPNLFRVRPGPFVLADLGDGSFAQFADAHVLMEHNTYLVGRDVGQARAGDLIFYRQLEQDSPYHSPYHSMIVCGEKGIWVVYHTGPIHQGRGEMRRLLVRDLLRHPDPRWRPLDENANFLGVYRWNILREGE